MKKLRYPIFLGILFVSAPLVFAQMNRSWYKSPETIDEYWGNARDRGSLSQLQAIENMKKAVEGNDDRTESERISYFGRSLRKLSTPSIFQVRERIEAYDLVQSALLSIPGHAQYFVDWLAEAREKTEKPWLDGNYLRVRSYVRETMVHLPSPECIWALGEMLESKKDLWSREKTIEIVLEQREHGFQGEGIPSPKRFADRVLWNIGLRGYSEFCSGKGKEASQLWWEQVKSGERAFSFKGQSVEYRFRPDGTWETIPMIDPPDDLPSEIREIKASSTGKSPEPTPSPVPSKRPLWLIVSTAIILPLITLFGWRWKYGQKMTSL